MHFVFGQGAWRMRGRSYDPIVTDSQNSLVTNRKYVTDC
jgi:hypothetical protein